MREKEILTIAIPTFNENNKLVLQIDRILQQCKNLPVKIKVFDNNPFSDFDFKKFPLGSFEYFRNPYNLGADWNIFSCMLNCNTEYLWILSTNDLIKSDSVIGILNEINVAKKNECCFVHMGQSEQFYTIGINEFVDKIVYEDSFTISRCLYNITALRENFIDYYSLVNTNQGQAYIIFAFLIKNPKGTCYFTNYEPIEKYLPSEWSKARFIKNTLSIVLNYSEIFRNEGELLKVIKKKIQKMLFFQLFISRSYQKMNLFYFLIYFIRISLLNIKGLNRTNILFFLHSLIDFKYYRKLRRLNWGIKKEDDFKFN